MTRSCRVVAVSISLAGRLPVGQCGQLGGQVIEYGRDELLLRSEMAEDQTVVDPCPRCDVANRRCRRSAFGEHLRRAVQDRGDYLVAAGRNNFLREVGACAPCSHVSTLHRSQTTTDVYGNEEAGLLQRLLVAGYQQPLNEARFRALTHFHREPT